MFMDSQRVRGIRGWLPDLPLALKSIAGFWIFYFITVLARMLLLGEDHHLVERNALGILVGIVLTFLIYLVIRRGAGETLKVKVIVAALACLPASAIFATFNLAFVLYQPLASRTVTEKAPDGTVLSRNLERGELRVDREGGESIVVQMPAMQEIMRRQMPRLIATNMVTWYFFFAAWASFYIAMSSAAQLRNAERRAAQFEREAQSAQLRALRYQVNPHFLFNTLNSLSSLIMARRPDEAETMIVNMSNFFRSTLAIDPTADVSLAEEIALQMLYLDIEKVRFPKRLHVVTEIPDRLGKVRVPALLLQPIIENVIKYAVARAKDVVTLTIRASDDGGRLHIFVENTGDPAEEPSSDHGTGVGLGNVCARLSARFGEAAQCRFGRRPEGGFSVHLTMPLVKHGN